MYELYPMLLSTMLPFSQMGTTEYAERTPVSEEVVDDIAEWLGGLR